MKNEKTSIMIAGGIIGIIGALQSLINTNKKVQIMNEKIYLDNGSTTFPKPTVVADAVYHYMTRIGSNINRGCYYNAYSIEEIVYETRQMLCDLFHGPSCKNVVFTKNITESLNILIKGFLQANDHVLVSSMEHNEIMRPLTQLEKQGIRVKETPCFSN